jgi:redox-sensitive bicupin YhaK (pirin superfamily)
MITLRKASERGHNNFGWLDTYHTFSFGDYYDPAHMGFRSLRVMNDDVVEGGHGFPTHPHRDMEIITWVLSGSLEHKDSMGTGSVIRPGDMQRMTAGTGVFHSEYNPSKSESVRLMQIWLLPERRGLTPGYEQKSFPIAERSGQLRLIASPDGRDGSVTVHQDVAVYTAILKAGEKVALDLAPGRHAWLQVPTGGVKLNGKDLGTADGAAVSEETRLSIEATADAEILLFDLA